MFIDPSDRREVKFGMTADDNDDVNWVKIKAKMSARDRARAESYLMEARQTVSGGMTMHPSLGD